MPPAPKSVSSLWVALGCVALGGLAYATPLLYVTSVNSSAPDPSKPLSAAAVRRGPFNNSGSKDVGLDK